MPVVTKGLSLALILVLAASSLILIQNVSATVPKPAIPEFTVKYAPATYSVTTTDPYTGQAVTTQYKNNSIQIAIKNQQYTYTNNGAAYTLYYNLRFKPHFDGDWTELYAPKNYSSTPYNQETKSWTFTLYLYTQEMPLSMQPPTQTNTEYTVITIPLSANYLFSQLPDNAQIDFQVDAMIGHDAQVWVIQHPLYPEYGGFYTGAVAYDTDSGWSKTQIVTIGSESTSSTTNPSATDTATTTTPSQNPPETPNQSGTQNEAGQNGSEWMQIALFASLCVIIALLVVIVLQQRGKRRTLGNGAS